MSDREAFLRARSVSRETLEKLDRYVAELTKWAGAINLVSRPTLNAVWVRHILDSAQVFDVALAQGRALDSWADLGSGAGLPGLVCAILASDRLPACQFHLVESDGRKAAFLASAARACGISVRIHAERIETLAPLHAGVVTARALAPLVTLLGYAVRHMEPAGVAIFPKGASHEAEIAEALATWRFTLQKHPSTTERDSVVLAIGDIQHV